MIIIMVHQQYWSNSNNDAATDAILFAYISLQSDSASPFTHPQPPHQQMGRNARMRAAEEKSSSHIAS